MRESYTREGSGSAPPAPSAIDFPNPAADPPSPELDVSKPLSWLSGESGAPQAFTIPPGLVSGQTHSVRSAGAGNTLTAVASGGIRSLYFAAVIVDLTFASADATHPDTLDLVWDGGPGPFWSVLAASAGVTFTVGS